MIFKVGQQANVITSTSIKIDGFNRLIFDKRELKAAIRKGGNVVKTEARRLIARRAVSGAGDLPGRVTGAMSKSIKTNVGSGGGYVRVMPYMTEEMRKYTATKKNPKGSFYPAFLFYGTSRGLKPRKDFMLQALDNKQVQIRSAISASLLNAIRTA